MTLFQRPPHSLLLARCRYHRVSIESISLGAATPLALPELCVGHGCIVDSGTTFSYLPHAAYSVLAGAVRALCMHCDGEEQASRVQR